MNMFCEKKTATIKRFKYSSLGSELKKQIDFVQKQYQGLDKTFIFNKKEAHKTNENHKKLTVKKYKKLDLIYDSKQNFYKYHDIKKFNSLSFEFKIFIFKQVLLGFK